MILEKKINRRVDSTEASNRCYVAVCNNYANCNKLQTALNCKAVCNTLQTAFRVLKNADKTKYVINVQIKRSLK